MGKIVNDVRELIGNTPMLRINSWQLPKGVEILAKLEYMNPGGSVKDRLGMSIIREAKRSGQLVSGGTIIEPTAGNTGIGIAMAALNTGYRIIFVVPQKFSIEKQQLMKALGAEVVNTPTAEGVEGAIKKAHELAADIPNSYVPNQFSTPYNALAHYQTTGPEIFAQLAGNIDFFVAGVGSGGTFSGAAKFLKEKIPSMQAVAVEPQGSILGGGPAGSHRTEGIGVDFIPETLNTSLIDEVITVMDDEAFQYTATLAKQEGLLVGSSSGAAFAAALKIARRQTGPARIVVILPDRSDRYFSKDIYDMSFENSGGI